ncbi:MAG: hypothetical protein KA173_04780 [Rhodoferax sp.]|nr:hypothetical protein [Rhodoferax sp.]MBP7492578.1 hypothetical protein [Rhodoferax sp.]
MKSVKLGNEAITAPVLLLVEGQDEEYLVQKMCQHWFKDRAKLIDIECVDGADNFPPRFKALKVRSLGELKVVGVIADSEENPEATAQRWQGLFDDVTASIAQPCTLLQLPTHQLPGAFETMLLNALDGDPVVGCAKVFRDCVLPHIGQRTQAQKDKIAVQAWLSASLGSAYGNVFKAQKKYPEKALLNYDHAAFEPIKQFIQGLLADVEVVLP